MNAPQKPLTKDELLAKKTEIEDRLKRIEEDLKKPLDPDLKEQALQLENREVLSQLRLVEQQNLAKINEALERIKD